MQQEGLPVKIHFSCRYFQILWEYRCGSQRRKTEAAQGVAAGAGAGGYDGLKEAAEAMGGHISRVYMPEERYRQHYDALYKEYKTLYQYFGRENQIMKRLKRQAERGDGD